MSTLNQLFGGSTVASIPVELLIAGGGGAGGGTPASTAYAAGGGGGAGALVYSSAVNLVYGSTYTIVIGAGGAGATGLNSQDGNNSSFGTYEAGGGGAGYVNRIGRSGTNGTGSGGGASMYTTSVTEYTARPVSNGFSVDPSNLLNFFIHGANKGGDTLSGTFPISARGGGAGSPGLPNGSIFIYNYQYGGAGLPFRITGSLSTYCTGGRGANEYTSSSNGTNGTANTGNGGDGAAASSSSSTPAYTGGNGGSGVVVIAYLNTYPAPTSITGTYTQPSRSGYRVFVFTGSGSITF